MPLEFKSFYLNYQKVVHVSQHLNLNVTATYFLPRPDNSATDNSADLKFRQFSQNYVDNSAKDNSANNCDRRVKFKLSQTGQKLQLFHCEMTWLQA